MNETILNYAGAAKLLRVAESTVRALVHRRRIPHFRLSRRLVRFNRSDLVAWMKSHAVRPANSSRGPC